MVRESNTKNESIHKRNNPCMICIKHANIKCFNQQNELYVNHVKWVNIHEKSNHDSMDYISKTKRQKKTTAYTIYINISYVNMFLYLVLRSPMWIFVNYFSFRTQEPKKIKNKAHYRATLNSEWVMEMENHWTRQINVIPPGLSNHVHIIQSIPSCSL